MPIVAQGAFGTFLFRQFFMRLPDEMYEAARLDGAGLLAAVLAVDAAALAPGPDGLRHHHLSHRLEDVSLAGDRRSLPGLKVLPMAIAELSGNASQDRGVMMAAVALSILPILILYIVAQRWFVEGIAMTGQKG